MAVLFTAFRLVEKTSRPAVMARMQAVEDHYLAQDSYPFIPVRYFDEQTGLGLHAIVQEYDNEKLRYLHDDDERVAIATKKPFGYSRHLATGAAPTIVGRLSAALQRDPGVIEDLHAPFCLVTLDKRQSAISVHQDVLGMERIVRLEASAGVAISNRPVAAHLMLLHRPRPSVAGWAVDQMSGWFHSGLTAFEDTFQLQRGSVLVLDRTGESVRQINVLSRWFGEQPPRSIEEGYRRLAAEIHDFGEYQADCGLSGGRDSRAVAAAASLLAPSIIRFRTSYPPVLERDIARRLVERMDQFDRFEDEDKALRADGSILWRARQRAQATKQKHPFARARDWARLHEGGVIAQALLADAPSTHFRSSASVLTLTGVGGEISRAYQYVRGQSSEGTGRARFFKHIETPVQARLETHPLTSRNYFDFVGEECAEILKNVVASEFSNATSDGVGDYRFFDYWYLIARMRKETPALTSNLIIPYLVPEFLRAAVTESFERKLTGELTKDMITRFRPNWSDIPYFDELKKTMPEENTNFFVKKEYLWEGDYADEFRELIHDSPAFDYPFDKGVITAHFDNSENFDANDRLATNVKAHGLLHRHAFVELCSEVEGKIDALLAGPVDPAVVIGSATGAAQGKP